MANEQNNVWNVRLRRNTLNLDGPVEYFAEVETAPVTLTNERIAARMVERGCELDMTTILSVLDRKDALVAEALRNGEKVRDGVLHIEPAGRGKWPSPDNPHGAGKQKAGLTVTLTAETRAWLAAIRLHPKGEAGDGAFIGGIYIIPSTEKAKTLRAGDDVLVTGDKIGIVPIGEEGLGVFFTNTAGTDFPLDHRLVENSPKRLVFRVPALPPETYTLKVITRRTSSGKTLLKAPRTIVYAEPLTVLAPEPEACKKAPAKAAATTPYLKKAATKKAAKTSPAMKKPDSE
jgi:hypothetical protein